SAVACSAGAQPAASTDRNSPATYLPLIRIETPLVEKDAPSCHCRPACVTGPGAAVRGAPSLRLQALPPATNNCTSLHRWACMPCTSLGPPRHERQCNRTVPLHRVEPDRAGRDDPRGVSIRRYGD